LGLLTSCLPAEASAQAGLLILEFPPSRKAVADRRSKMGLFTKHSAKGGQAWTTPFIFKPRKIPRL